MQNPIVTFETTKGVIKAALYPEIAPNTVNNFISLVSRGFYDGTIFHLSLIHICSISRMGNSVS